MCRGSILGRWRSCLRGGCRIGRWICRGGSLCTFWGSLRRAAANPWKPFRFDAVGAWWLSFQLIACLVLAIHPIFRQLLPSNSRKYWFCPDNRFLGFVSCFAITGVLSRTLLQPVNSCAPSDPISTAIPYFWHFDHFFFGWSVWCRIPAAIIAPTSAAICPNFLNFDHFDCYMSWSSAFNS